MLYGLTAFGISRQTDLTPDQGQRFIDLYFERYPHIRKYTDETKEKCRALGYVETVLGRRRYLPDITSRNFNVRAGAERRRPEATQRHSKVAAQHNPTRLVISFFPANNLNITHGGFSENSWK